MMSMNTIESPQSEEIELIDDDAKPKKGKKNGKKKVKMNRDDGLIQKASEKEDIDGKLRSAGFDIEELTKKEKEDLWQAVRDSLMDSAGASTSTAHFNRNSESPTGTLQNDPESSKSPQPSQEGPQTYQEGRQSFQETTKHPRKIHMDTETAHESPGSLSKPLKTTNTHIQFSNEGEEISEESVGASVEVVELLSDESLNNERTNEENNSTEVPEKMEVDDDDETQPPDVQDDSPCLLNLEESTLAPESEPENDEVDDLDEETQGFKRSESTSESFHLRLSPSSTTEQESNIQSGKKYRQSDEGNEEVPDQNEHVETQDPDQDKDVSSSHTQSSQNSQAGSELQRHYRGVKCKYVHKYNYFGPDNVTDKEFTAHALSILKQFDAFKSRLLRAQSLFKEKLEWGEPVKPGQHFDGSLDVKVRGREPFSLKFLEESSEDEQCGSRLQSVSKHTRERKTRNHESFVTDKEQEGSIEDDDDFETIRSKKTYRRRKKLTETEDLPELIIEDNNSNEKFNDRFEITSDDKTDGKDLKESLSSENHYKRTVPVYSRDTKLRHEIDVKQNDLGKTLVDNGTVGDKTFAEEKTAKGGTTLCSIPQIIKTSSDKMRGRRKVKAGTILVAETQDFEGEGVDESEKATEKVIAETQDYFDEDQIQLAIQRSKLDQGGRNDLKAEDDIEYLQVRSNVTGDRFDNPMHKTKLLGYQIPKKTATSVTSNNSNDRTSLDDKTNNVKKAPVVSNIVVKGQVRMNKGHESKADRGSRLSRHRKKPAVSLVEETQEPEDDLADYLGGEGLETSASKKQKRKTFRLNSDSSDELCVPESQEADLSPEIHYDRKNKDGNGASTIKDVSEDVIEIDEDSRDQVVTNIGKTAASDKDKVDGLDEEYDSIKLGILKKNKKHRKSAELMEENEKTLAEFEVKKESLEGGRSSSLKRQHGSISEDDSDQESQSPVIKKKQRKVLREAEIDRNDIQRNDIELGREILLKRDKNKDKATVLSMVERGKNKADCWVESVSKGVRKLFSRPASHESDMSEASTTSSQVSAAMLDDKGDLYSTQLFERKKSKKKSIKILEESEEEKFLEKEAEIDEILCLDDDDLEVTKVTKTEKTYSKRRPINVVQGTRKSLKNPTSENISHYFNQPKASPSNIDLDVNLSNCRLPSFDMSPSIGDVGDFEAGVDDVKIADDAEVEIEDPFGGRTENHRKKEKNAAIFKPPEEKVACPICNIEYSISEIEGHASTCTGPDNLDDSRDDYGTEGDGERECLYCEKMVSAGPKFQRHVENCRAVAEREQAELERKGFNQVYQQVNIQEEAEARTTRARRRPLHDTTIGDTAASPARACKKGKLHAPEEGYKTESKDTDKDDDSSDGSGSYSSSECSSTSDCENFPLKTYVQTGSNSLLSGPWNKPLQTSTQNQSTCNTIPDWAANINSPIKTFVPISQQEDADYFNRQFSYKQNKVMERMKKRKRTKTGRKRRKRRKVTRKGKK